MKPHRTVDWYIQEACTQFAAGLLEDFEHLLSQIRPQKIGADGNNGVLKLTFKRYPLLGRAPVLFSPWLFGTMRKRFKNLRSFSAIFLVDRSKSQKASHDGRLFSSESKKQKARQVSLPGRIRSSPEGDTLL